MLKDKLREARKAAGMTQKQVAQAIGVTESAYCGYETGKRTPDAMKIRRIAAAIGISGDFLLETGFEYEKKAPAAEKSTTRAEKEAEAMQLISSLDDYQFELLRMYLETLTGAVPADRSTAHPSETK